MIDKLLPYFDERIQAPDILVLHCLKFGAEVGIKNFETTRDSVHYIIEPNGTIYRLISEDKCARHAGKSYWRGRESINRYSIGIELCSPSLGQQPYDKRQLNSLLRLCKRIIRRYHIKPQNIVGHSDIAPMRKPDPGKAFPWAYLARYGVGLWYDENKVSAIREENEAVLLAQIGYDVTDLTATKWAFCRRFIPDVVPADEDIQHLVDNPYPLEFTVDSERFLKILKAVHYAYTK